MAAQAFLMVAPFLRPPGGVGSTPPLPYWLYSVVGIAILVAAVIYWLVWVKVLPAIGRYRLVPEHEKLADGTAVIVYQKVKTTQSKDVKVFSGTIWQNGCVF
ncbi:uncharacterized protein LY89DRAFT_733782 [Mollisia scopiformis]|uniref:Uncharacterized protein n=1 Tax=Mollisia scopiformis TaxID=149040 RepID=A0A194X9D0_MOLSC|nr:uncharacterized protein LY89DRAFT_733782 [Mollisia scopiformis]KUJ16776.1 hypothetical protein LY89DRAFT_733782 [Mollisia scopiformis]